LDLIVHFRRLFSYDSWANREVIRAMTAAEPLPGKSLKLIAHVSAAERIWWDRLQAKAQAVPVWPDWTFAECEARASEMEGMWKEYLMNKAESDFAMPVSYVNSKGKSFSNTPYDILLHVITHSAHHRGQIASDMRAAGFTPAYTDYIHGVRQGLVE
jgi:uncharacterized damage-inducible protein DinB